MGAGTGKIFYVECGTLAFCFPPKTHQIQPSQNGALFLLKFILSKEHVDAIKRNTRQFSGIDFPVLMDLAEKRLKATLSIYDVETSNFRNTWNFGITELSMLSINPDGSMYMFSSLFNPGYPITPIVAEKTGITDDMVRTAPSWKSLGAPLFHHLAHKGNHLLGYNNKRFDRWCISDSNTRCNYCGALVKEEREYDIYPVVTKFFGRKVKLSDAAQRLSIDMASLGGSFHRAGSDVIATAFVADRVLNEMGFDILFMNSCSRTKKVPSGETQKQMFPEKGCGKESGRVFEF